MKTHDGAIFALIQRLLRGGQFIESPPTLVYV